jgi:hypothetical protein
VERKRVTAVPLAIQSSMSDDNDKKEAKKVTAAITDAPQEEFISPTNVPTKVEHESADNETRSGEPPRTRGTPSKPNER